MAESKMIRDRELAALREKKLTTLFNKHFSEAAAAIAAERKAAEVALREIERRRAEAALKVASNGGELPNGQTLTKLDEMYFELKRREENVRKRERDTLEKYHRYMQKGELPFLQTQTKGAVVNRNGHFANDLRNGIPDVSTSSMYYKDADFKVEQGNVDKNVKRFSSRDINATASSPSQHIPTSGSGVVKSAADKINGGGYNQSVTFSADSKRSSSVATGATEICSSSSSEYEMENFDSKTPMRKNMFLKSPKSPPMTEEALFLNAQAAAAQAEHDGKVEESKLQAQLAERNANLMAKSLSSWKHEDDSDNLTITSYGASSLEESITTANSQGSALIFVSEAEMRLTAFLKANTEALTNLSNHANSDDSDTNTLYSASARKEFDEAVGAAEQAAKEMAEAMAWTSNSCAESATSSVKKKKKEKWLQYWSEEHAREYYYQPSTGKVAWEPPSEYEDSGTMVKKSAIEEGKATEEEKVRYEVQNWSMDDFLPERKQKKSKSKRNLMKNIDNDTASRGSKGSRGSRGTVGSRRRGLARQASLSQSILSSPDEDHSIWNKKNRKQRKKIVRRTIWGLVLTGVAYKTGTGIYSFYSTNDEVAEVSVDPVPTESTNNVGRKERRRKETIALIPEATIFASGRPPVAKSESNVPKETYQAVTLKSLEANIEAARLMNKKPDLSTEPVDSQPTGEMKDATKPIDSQPSQEKKETVQETKESFEPVVSQPPKETEAASERVDSPRVKETRETNKQIEPNTPAPEKMKVETSTGGLEVNNGKGRFK